MCYNCITVVKFDMHWLQKKNYVVYNHGWFRSALGQKTCVKGRKKLSEIPCTSAQNKVVIHQLNLLQYFILPSQKRSLRGEIFPLTSHGI